MSNSTTYTNCRPTEEPANKQPEHGEVLAKFGYLAAQSAQHSNRLFKAKKINDNLMLMDKHIAEVEMSTMAVLKHLDDMEVTWVNKQKEKKKQRLRENLEKKVKANDIVDRACETQRTWWTCYICQRTEGACQ